MQCAIVVSVIVNVHTMVQAAFSAAEFIRRQETLVCGGKILLLHNANDFAICNYAEKHIINLLRCCRRRSARLSPSGGRRL